MTPLKETFLNELADIYDAEKQIAKALPKLSEAASTEDLKDALDIHMDETEGQIERLDQVFELLGKPAKGKKCKAMQGLIEEGEELIKEQAGDAALIAAAQKVEHYEIAAYGSLCSWARMLDKAEAAELLEETLDEEKSTDEKLTEIAEDTVNPEHAGEEGEAGDEEEKTEEKDHSAKRQR